MKLQIINKANNLEDCVELAEQYFKCKLKIFKTELSIFDQYELRAMNRKYIPKIWQYRIIGNKGEYHFGTIEIVNEYELFD